MTTATVTKTKASSTSLTIPRTELLAAVKAAAKAISKNGRATVLQNIRIGDGLVTGTDLEVRIDSEISEMCEPFLVPCTRLLAILNSVQGETVTLSESGNAVKVKCGGGSWTLPTESVEEFPQWEPSDLVPVFRLPADQFARAARGTIYACDKDSTRYSLGGVLFEVQDGNPTWVSTDGRRMSIVETETDQAVDDSRRVVPAKTLAIVFAMSPGTGAVQVDANNNEIRFSMESLTVTARLLPNNFPRWRDALEKPNKSSPTSFDRTELLRAVQAAAIVTSEQSKGIDVQLGGDTVTLTGQSSEYGQSKVTCQVLQPGHEVKTKLDPRFLSDYLRALPPDEDPSVSMSAADDKSPIIMKCSDYTGVIMPLAKDA